MIPAALLHEGTMNTKDTKFFLRSVFVNFVALRGFVKKGW